jgi:hypothetical protein
MARETTPAPGAAEPVRGEGRDRIAESEKQRADEAKRLGQGDVTGPGGKTSTGGSEEADPGDGFPGNSAVDVGPGPGGTDDDEQRAQPHPSGEFPETVAAEDEEQD